MRLVTSNKLQTNLCNPILSNEPLPKTEVVRILNEVMDKFGESGKVSLNSDSEDELNVTGLSGQALHDFTLRCEELGRRVDYEKRTVIHVH